jgi:predicted transcriptional regulator
MKTPCEKIVWDVVPFIKKEFAKMLVYEFNCNQKEAAEKLDTTEAAVSRYLSGKRGVLEITDKEILGEIRKSSEKISKKNKINTSFEVCRICKLIRKKNFIGNNPELC